ncbi:type VI secretion system baseplate subunit TssF [Herbaspirillum sp. RTI4]|uniref:type VI secretion system baseplate subunit TssF n=1 Tax=Herbaspirillum sp. RTI4 TaxID=3048640 RepID=UPI002AB4DEC1|nr:type VI secretion system baseplate subunit TssF [Herbaspirillum sp. RTI4]MDY7579026.1 type VI secretion system baseplate subunit TssF [Herbaspirillum sp. RTI4]MEA9980957.1 type VI secretion system baseplate subunit TssF [Herbaspirillum sp. RTI4]
MDELLPYYERELGFLRRYSRKFAERYPKIAGRLLMAGEVSEDPHIERMIQSFALINARTSKRLDDDYPEFTEALFEVLYPHYLRPFPSCSIVRIPGSDDLSKVTQTTIIPRGTQLKSHVVDGVACKFRTSFDVAVTPLLVSHARFDAIPMPPDTVVLPPDTSSGISISLETANVSVALSQLGVKKVRIFIDGEPSFCAGLRDALFMNTVCAYVEAADSRRWVGLPALPIEAVGFNENESLIDFPARSHPAYRLLTEYFSYPEKFNFFDIDLEAICRVLPVDEKKFTLHLTLTGLRSDSNVARMLSTLSANNFLLGCSPVINLFPKVASPVLLTHATANYSVIVDGNNAPAFEVYSIDSVTQVLKNPEGESFRQFRPYYSLRHGETPASNGHYWAMRRDDTVAKKSPGYETEISIVDIDFNPAEIGECTLSIEVTSTNRDLPSYLAYGLEGGDLSLSGEEKFGVIRFLRKPSEPYRFTRGRGAHWRLISHLSLNHLSLARGGLDALKEVLSLYDLPRSATSHRQVAGLVSIDHKSTSAWLRGNPFASLVRGIEIRLTLDEEGFIGSGIHVFTHILDRFFGLYAHANSFTQLVIFSKRTGEEIVRCLPRSGDSHLV